METATRKTADLTWLMQVAGEVARRIGATGAFYGAFVPGWECLASAEDAVACWPATQDAANTVARRLADYMRGRRDSMPAAGSIYWSPDGVTLPCAGAEPGWRGGMANTARVAVSDALPAATGLLAEVSGAAHRAWEHGVMRPDALEEFITGGLALCAHWKLASGGTRKDAADLVREIAATVDKERK